MYKYVKNGQYLNDLFSHALNPQGAAEWNSRLGEEVRSKR